MEMSICQVENGFSWDELKKVAAELIKSTGISKKKVAELAGAGQDTITRWCKGESPTPKLLLEKLQKINQVINE